MSEVRVKATPALGLADYVRRSQRALARVETSRVAYLGRTAGR